MNDAIGIVAAFSKREAAQLASELADYLTRAGRTVIDEAGLNAESLESVAAIMVLGGDGLMMRAANQFPDVPLFGINFGKVGFLAMVEQANWRASVDDFLAGDYAIQDGSTLNATVVRAGESLDQGWAINDVVIRGGVRMIEIE